MILDSPGTSPSVIAHAHGFSAVEVAELLPIFLDNLRTTQRPGETAEEHADRYLRELAQNEHLDVVGYHTLGPAEGDLDDLDADLDADPSFLDEGPEESPSAEVVELGTDPAGDLTDGDVTNGDLTADEPTGDDLTADDPFAAPIPVLPGADDPGPDVGVPVDDSLDDPVGDMGDSGGPHAVG
jgi:hypothetical protein